MLGLLMGNMLRGALAGPLAICAIVTGVFAVCGCVKCMRCNLRDCACVKRLLRMTGHDEFDDFELMILVHEALFERKDAKMVTVVRVTAGNHVVKTDPNSNGIFQQPLHIDVEQGTSHISVDLLDGNDTVLATLPLDVGNDVLSKKSLKAETVHAMKAKSRKINNPKIKLTMVIGMNEDAEKGLLAGSNMNSETDILVRQQLRKAKQEGSNALPDGESITEMEVLKKACAGPLELFQGLGKTDSVFVAVLGPPMSRKWIFGIWWDSADFKCKKKPIQEIELLKIESVQADPTRHHVFVVNYFDDSRVRQTLTFRRTDRARDVWVEILFLLVTKARESKVFEKRDRTRAKTHLAKSDKDVQAESSRSAKTRYG